jgi:hypothetical protein
VPNGAGRYPPRAHSIRQRAWYPSVQFSPVNLRNFTRCKPKPGFTPLRFLER